ncbi:MAG: NERD domain-containing protein [Solirubrobacterales bacterium]|nr:NERD domain-containing protein [Solirubrobacterales bacterium]
MIDEPSSTKVWKQGGEGEVRTASRLEKHVAGTGVRLLHDRRIPGHGKANIDHVAIGSGGVTVIDTKTHRGTVAIDRVGGLFAPRRTVLLINGRDRTSLIDGVEAQVGYVRAALSCAGHKDLDICGALCFPNVDGLPLFRQLAVRDVAIDGPKPIAKLAGRQGRLGAAAVDLLWQELARLFPQA